MGYLCINFRMFSKACEYGVRAVIYIGAQSSQEKRASLKDIARQIDSPEAFTAKILQQLTRSNIIDSVKGPAGGFTIDKRKINKIKLGQVVAAIDGDGIYKGCGLGLKACSEKRPCPLHDKFKSVREEIRCMMENTYLHELSHGLKNGMYLKI